MLDMMFLRAFCIERPADESLSDAKKAVGVGLAEIGIWSSSKLLSMIFSCKRCFFMNAGEDSLNLDLGMWSKFTELPPPKPAKGFPVTPLVYEWF